VVSTHLEGAIPVTGWKNKRATVRYRCAPATPGRLILPEGQEYQRAWVLTLSRGGVGLHVARKLEPGTLLVIQLKGNASGKSYELAAQVAHVTPQLGDEWLIGCAILRPLTEQDLDDLL